jgi:hypothetical protein
MVPFKAIEIFTLNGNFLKIFKIVKIFQIKEIMKNNSLNKLSVFSLSLLLSMNFIMVTDSMHPKPVNLDKFKKNIDFQRSGYIKARLSHLELKEMQEAANFLEQHRIFPKEIFTNENARFALS